MIKYQIGHFNKAADALSHHPYSPESYSEGRTDSNEAEVISYLSVCKAVDYSLESSKIPDDLKGGQKTSLL